MAVVLAVKRWYHYLMGHQFIIRTDQKALRFLLEQRIMDADQQKWVAKLMGYRFEIKYKKRKENKTADTLSRRGGNGELNAFSLWQFKDFQSWETEIQQDEKLRDIYTKLVKGE